MFIRINDIPLGDLPQSQEAWVESQLDNGNQFVSIEDGDWSVVRSIDTESHPLEYVTSEHPGEYVVCDKDSPEADILRSMGYEERKGYYSDQAVFIHE